jgi:hypothetical protein
MSPGGLSVAVNSLRQEPCAAPYNGHHECGDAKDELINLPNRIIFLYGLTFVGSCSIFTESIAVTVAVAVYPFGEGFEDLLPDFRGVVGGG